jgi:hypothetical protein
MAKYLISFPSAAMVVPDAEWGAVGRDAHPFPKTYVDGQACNHRRRKPDRPRRHRWYNQQHRHSGIGMMTPG